MGADESCNVSWPECWMQLRDMCYQEVLKLSGYWQMSGDFWAVWKGGRSFECDKSCQTFWPSFVRVSGSYGFGNMIVE